MPKSALLILFLVLSFGCSETRDSSKENIPGWENSFATAERLSSMYFSDAIHINTNGGVINGASAISDFWIDSQLAPDSTFTHFEIVANDDNEYMYEIGGFTTTGNEKYAHILIHNIKGAASVRELEFFAQRNDAEVDLNIIDQRRQDWMEYCNAKDAEGLVQNLYTENAVYYNHRPVLIGREALTEEYQYMNNPDYSLTLIPLHVEVVNDRLVFEIGRCEGSYNGKYMLVWQLDDDESWNVLMDSNI